MWPPNHPATSSNQDLQPPESGSKKKLRAACDRCHQAKTKCTGGSPCQSCASSGNGDRCQYSFTTRTGRPKGAKNKPRTQIKGKQQPESDSSHDNFSPAESSNSGSLFQPPLSGPFTPSSQFSLDQGLMEFDALILDAASSDSISDHLSQSIHSSNLGEFLDRDTGMYLHGNRSFLSNAPEPMDTRQPTLSSPMEHTQEQSYPIRSQSIAVSSPTNFITEGMMNTMLGGPYGNYPSSTEENFLNPQLLAPGVPSIHGSSSSSSVRATEQHGGNCNCLQQHTELLRHLNSLTQGQNALRIDNVLTSVQQALAPWQYLIHCSNCSFKEDHSVLLLALMSIRVILRHMQQICFGTSSQSSGYTAPEQPSTFSVITAGGYQPTGNEQKHIMDLLIFHALRKIKYVLSSLKKKFTQARAQRHAGSSGNPRVTARSGQASPTDSEPDVGSIHSVFENLERSVNSFVNAIRTRNSGGPPGQSAGQP